MKFGIFYEHQLDRAGVRLVLGEEVDGPTSGTVVWAAGAAEELPGEGALKRLSEDDIDRVRQHLPAGL